MAFANNRLLLLKGYYITCYEMKTLIVLLLIYLNIMNETI